MTKFRKDLPNATTVALIVDEHQDGVRFEGEKKTLVVNDLLGDAASVFSYGEIGLRVLFVFSGLMPFQAIDVKGSKYNVKRFVLPPLDVPSSEFQTAASKALQVTELTRNLQNLFLLTGGYPSAIVALIKTLNKLDEVRREALDLQVAQDVYKTVESELGHTFGPGRWMAALGSEDLDQTSVKALKTLLVYCLTGYEVTTVSPVIEESAVTFKDFTKRGLIHLDSGKLQLPLLCSHRHGPVFDAFESLVAVSFVAVSGAFPCTW